MSSKVAVNIKGMDIAGWETIRITRSVEAAASTFEVSIADVEWDDIDLLDINIGDDAEILYEGKPLVTGYISDDEVDGDATTHIFRFAGKSKTADLVENSADIASEFKNQTLEQIANKLAEKSNVKVIVKGGSGKAIPSFQVNQNGETVFQAIERLAEKESLYITDTPNGELLLSNIGTTTNNVIKHTSTENTGVKAYNRKITDNERYSKITVKAQQKTTDKNFGKKANQVIFEVVDDSVKRSKEKVIVADSDMTVEEAKERANWEMKSSAGKSDTITYVITGWKQNELWRENQKINIDDDYVNFEGEMIIASCEYVFDDGGEITRLTLNPSEAFIKGPEDKKKEHKKREAGDKKRKKKKGKKEKKGSSKTVLSTTEYYP